MRQVRVESRRASFRVLDTAAAAEEERQEEDVPVLFLMHGLGATLQSFACLIKSLPNKQGLRCVAFDARGHGGTVCDDAREELDLSLDTLVQDAVALIREYFPNPSATRLILCGHSMGGVIAVHLANQIQKLVRVEALIVLEAIEGFARAMLALEEGKGGAQLGSGGGERPKRFDSVENAVAWACSPKGPLSHAAFSAQISIPDQLKQANGGGFTWRVDIEQSARYWPEWYRGLSALFVNTPVRWKALLVSSLDKLDAELTVAHMQGKFQLLLVGSQANGGGHFLHELFPGQTATVMTKFIQQQQQQQQLQGGSNEAKRGMTAQEILALSARLKRPDDQPSFSSANSCSG